MVFQEKSSRTLRSTWWFTLWAGLVLVVFALSMSAPARADYPTGDVAKAMEWLPDDIENVSYARGPLPIRAIPDKKSDAAPPPAPPLGISSQFYMSDMWLPIATKRLPGRTILFSMEGKRKFTPPKDKGPEKYEGCGIISLQPQPGVTQDLINRALQDHAKKRPDIQGVAVSLVSGKETRTGGTSWDIYLAAPDPDTILVATSLDMLEHVIGQIKAGAQPGATSSFRPLGPLWQGWSYVDTNSRFWIVRHDVSHAAGQDPNDISVYEDVPTQSLLLTGIMSDKIILFNAISNLHTETHMRVVTKEIARGTYQIQCWLDGDAENLVTLSYYLTQIFGPLTPANVVAPF